NAPPIRCSSMRSSAPARMCSTPWSAALTGSIPRTVTEASMKSICIVGLGAVGGTLGARLAASGIEVSALARGETLRAVGANGLSLRDGERELRVPVRVAAPAAELGPQPWLPAHPKSAALPALAPALGPLVGPDTRIVSMMNGVPWWFGHGLPRPPAALRLESVDPGGVVGANLPADQVIGTVTHFSAAVTAPGQVHRLAGERIIVGAPTPGRSPDCAPLVDALAAAGFETETSSDIHRDLWFKLWGNMTMNPISALTGATTDRILDDALVLEFASAIMREAAAIGAAIGLPIDVAPEERHALTRKLGAMRTSMLQDLEGGKPLEIDAIVAAVRELGQQLALPTPNIDTLLGLVRLRARMLGLYD